MLAQRRTGWLLGTALALLAVVGLLGWWETGWVGPSTVDTTVGEALVFHGSGPEITGLQVLTAPGAENIRYPVLMPIAGFLLWARRFRWAAFVAVPALVVSPVNRALKDVFDRPRPSYDGTTVTAGDWSFPSGHSSGAAVLAGVLLVLLLPYVAARWRPAFAVAAVSGAVMVAWTRLALGVHYLSDVVAGLALGSAVVLLALVVFRPPVSA